MCSDMVGIELGFTNNDAVYDDDDNIVFDEGNPILSHVNFYPKSHALVDSLPFDISFKDTRTSVITKAGQPTQTNQRHADFLNREFLIDNYKIDDIVITFDYDTDSNTINFIQVRDNNLRSDLKL